ncbi:peptidylprolyl isomerase [Pontiella sp.]|uniref:peptidylprolyl isomerase n=1 Tax=Pontiella sp. TaxID=2837462 RepID=UPI003567F4CD
MAMMISKFNKLIHNKTVWLVFAIFISVAFVMVYTGGGSNSAQKEQMKSAKETVGRLWGQDISYAEFVQAYRYTYASFALYTMMNGQQFNMNDEVEAFLNDRAWRRKAMLLKAGEMGLKVTPQQTIDMIKSQPFFVNPQTGQYDANAYSMFKERILPQLGLSAKDYELMMSEQVLIEKVTASAAQGALVTEDEINKAFHLYNDMLTIDYAFLPRSLAATPEVTEEEAKAYYESNPEEFRMPEKAMVHYVQFPVSDYLDTVTVTDEQVAQVYEQNKQRYIKPETATNAVPEYLALEEVKEELTTEIESELARRSAAAAADELVAALAEESTTFEAECTKAGLKIVKTTPAFAATDSVRGVDPSAPFARAAFKLQQTPTQYYSDPVVGRETVYVIALQKKLPSFVPAYEVVKDNALESARIAAAEKAYVEKADAVHRELKAALAGGTAFADAASKYNLEIQTTESFNILTPLSSDYGREIMGATIHFDQGTLVDLINTPDEFIVAYIATKEAADEATALPGMRDQLAAGIRQEKAQNMIQAWQDNLLDEAGFEDLSNEKS